MMQILRYFKRHGDLTKILEDIFFFTKGAISL